MQSREKDGSISYFQQSKAVANPSADK